MSQPRTQSAPGRCAAHSCWATLRATVPAAASSRAVAARSAVRSAAGAGRSARRPATSAAVPGHGDLGRRRPDLQRPLAHQVVDQLTRVRRIAVRLRGQPVSRWLS
jgi:hypothetical protein